MTKNERKFKIIGIQTSKRVDDQREYEFISNTKKSNILNLFESKKINNNESINSLELS